MNNLNGSLNVSMFNGTDKNNDCDSEYVIPPFINKSEFCINPVHFRCPTYPCFLDNIELTLAILGCFLNFLTIIALVHIGSNLKPRHRMLLSMSIIDVMTSGFHIVRLFYIFPSVFANSFRFVPVPTEFGLALVVGHIYTFIQYSAILNVLLLSSDVFVAVTFPLRHHRFMTKGIASKLVGAAWLLSFIMYVICLVVSYMLNKHTLIYIFFNAISLLCIVVLIIVYVKLLLLVCKRPEVRDKSKLTGTVIAILLTFTLFMLPGVWLSTLRSLFLKPNVFTWYLWYTFIKSLQCLCVLNTVCDAVIYIIRVPEVQQSFKIMFFACRRQIEIKCQRFVASWEENPGEDIAVTSVSYCSSRSDNTIDQPM